MATILRSLRYIRSSGAFARHVALNQKRNIIISINQHDSAALSASVADRKPYLPSNIEQLKNASQFENHMGKIQWFVQRRGWIWKEDIVQAINYIESAGHLNTSQVCSLIRWGGECIPEISPPERMKLVLELWDSLNLYNVPLDISHYNALIKVYEANNHTFSPTTLLTEMQCKDIKPDIGTYETLIAYYCKKGDIPNTKKILELMKEEGLAITEPILNSLILGHSEAGDLDSAVKTLRMMKDNNIVLTANTYTALMCAYAKVNDISTIEEIISACKSKKFDFGNQYVWKVIYALAANKHLTSNSKIFDHLSNRTNPLTEVVCVLKLMEIGTTDVALSRFEIVIEQIENPYLRDNYVNLFIKKLLWSDMESTEIVDICNRINEKNFARNSLLQAVYNSFFKNDQSLTLELLRSCHKATCTIRQHYFWPLLAQKGNKHDFQGILDILSCMITEFHLEPDVDTITDYVLPYAFGNAPDIVTLLKNQKISETVVHNAYVCYFLGNKKTRNAITHMIRFPSKYLYETLQLPLRKAVCETLDVGSFVQISQKLYASNESDFDFNDGTSAILNSTVSMDQQLMDFIYYCPNQKHVLLKVAAYIIQTQTRVERETIKAINDHLSGYADKDMAKLQQWTVLDPVSAADKESLTELLKKINARKERSLQTDRMESKLMDLLCKAVDNETAPLSEQLFSFAISNCCKDVKFENAQKFMKLAKKTYPEFGDSALQLEYATLLLKTVKYDAAYQHILKHLQLPVTNKTHCQSISLLKTVANAPFVTFEQLKKMFYVLKSNRYLNDSNEALSELIQDCVDKGALVMAVDIFCILLKEQDIPRLLKQQIYSALIKKREDVLLQRVVNKASKYEDLAHVTSDLFFCFLECDQLDQAQDIFQMYKLENNMHVWWGKIKEYQDNQDLINLEKFLVLTKPLLPLHRPVIYDSLIHICVMKNESQRALNVLAKMKEENLKPSESALYKLDNLLKISNQDIPFNRVGKESSSTATEDTKNENIVEDVKNENIVEDVKNENTVEDVKQALENVDSQKLQNC